MPPINDLISIVLLVLIFIIALVWLIINIRTIRFEKRIENYVIVKEKDEDLSLLGQVESFYQKINCKLVKTLKKIKLNSLFNGISDTEKELELSSLANKLLISITFLLIYIIVCILTTYNFDLVIGIIFFLVGYFIPIIQNKITTLYRNKKIENDLPKAVSLMNNAFQAGKSIIQAIEIVKIELDGPLADEFEKIENDLLHGLSLETAFSRLKNRLDIEDINYITTSLMILNQTGGNITSVFSSIEESFYTRKKLDSELNATIASSKLVFNILVVLPFFLWLIIGLWNPAYFTIFFQSEIGLLLFMIIICLYFLYIILIKSIMKVEKY